MCIVSDRERGDCVRVKREGMGVGRKLNVPNPIHNLTSSMLRSCVMKYQVKLAHLFPTYIHKDMNN